MIIHIHAISEGLPAWLNEGIDHYTKRFKHPYSLTIHTYPLAKRSKNSVINAIIKQESQLLLKAIPPNAFMIACDEQGQTNTTQSFTQKLQQWSHHNQMHFLIGGPDGHHPAIIQKSQYQLALSPMTLTHGMARLLLIEQLYRSICILNNHPYHRC